MLTLAVLVAAVIAVQMVPGGTEDSSAADIMIVLDNNSPGTFTGYSWSGNTLTISDYGNNYTITQNAAGVLDRNINIATTTSSSTVTITIKNINIKNSISLVDNAKVKLLLEGNNNVGGRIVVPYSASSPNTSLTIESLTNGSLDVKIGIGGIGIYTGTITINSGTVTATGGSGNAGIGGIDGTGPGQGGYGGTITINGGIVTATGGSNGGAGIGGGGAGGYSHGGSGGTITINGGFVTATGGSGAAGIGGGNSGVGGSGGTITINGGTVVAKGGTNAAGIGGASGSSIGTPGAGATLTINSGANVTAFSTGDRPAIHAASIADASTGYFVNAILDSNLPSNTTTLLVYAEGNTSTHLTILTPSGASYKNFAFMLPGPPSSKNYNIIAQNAEVSRQVLNVSDDSNVIASVRDVEATPVKLGTPISAVTDISGVPNKVVVGTLLDLRGTVSPANATYKTIVWNVKDAGTTGAVIDGNKLNTTGAGTVTVTATIANSTAFGTAFVKDFTIEVSTSGGGGGGGEPSGSGSMLMWVAVAAAIIALLIIAVFVLQKRGTNKGK